MGIFNFGKSVESAGNGISTAAEGIRFALSGDLPPKERIEYERLLLQTEEIASKLKEKQIDLNIQDSKSPSKFKSGWRPMLGWIAVTGFSLVFVLFPIFEWILNIYIVFNNVDITTEQRMALFPPTIDGVLLLNLLGALLGLGTLRTIEKSNGTSK